MKNKKKIKNKKTKSSIAKSILVNFLEHTLDCAEGFVDAFAYPYPSRDFYCCNSEKRARKELSQLKQRKYIEERKIGDRLELCLTDKGKTAALRYRIAKCDNVLKNKYCLVIFDIPESERKIRNFFRSFLKEADFARLQQSVWITQKDTGKDLEEMVRIAGAEKWVYIIMADSISNLN